MSWELCNLHKSDIRELASLHCRIFPDSRSTRLGTLYVKKMFTWFLQYQPQLSLIAREDNKIVGYVVGAIGGYGRKLFRYAVFEIAVGLITHPHLFLQKETFALWPSYLKGLIPKKKSRKIGTNPSTLLLSAALAGIGVDPKKQGLGIGRALVMGFENAAKQLNVEKLTLSVHLDNVSANKLYESCGWYQDNQDNSTNTAHYTKVIKINDTYAKNPR